MAAMNPIFDPGDYIVGKCGPDFGRRMNEIIYNCVVCDKDFPEHKVICTECRNFIRALKELMVSIKE